MYRYLFRACTLTIISLLFLCSAQSSPAFADTNFRFDLESTYTVRGTQGTQVYHALTITNKTPTYYVRQYALKITSGTAIKNVRVISDGQLLTPNVVTADTVTSIGISFPDKVVGEGQSRQLIISYEQQDASIVSGKVLELYVPPLNVDTAYDSYKVTLLTPASYGQPVRVTPNPTRTYQQGDLLATQFDQVTEKGVAALFGSEQLFNITLRYNLENTTDGPGLMQVALPPDTPYQKMHYAQLDPLPQKLEADVDGNWIATYQLPAGSQTVIYATAQARLTLEPNLKVPTTHPTSAYFNAQQYWELGDAAIQSAASQHKTPRQIYDHIVSTLTYGFDPKQGTPTRMGAAKTLTSKAPVTCQEFTDSFIALARSNQVAARRLTGYAHTENSALRPLSLVEDILHAWPEYYDESAQVWRQIDPTWGNTTGGVNYFDQFDLNHIVFAINGQSSVTPYPAGSYKLTDQNTKDVSVEFARTFNEVSPLFDLSLNQKKIFGIQIPGWSEIMIANRTGSAWYNIQVTASTTSDEISLQLANEAAVSVLPFQTARIPLRAIAEKQLWLTSTPIQVTMQAELTQPPITQTLYVSAGPSFIRYFSKPNFNFSLGFGGTGVAVAAGGLLVSRRK